MVGGAASPGVQAWRAAWKTRAHSAARVTRMSQGCAPAIVASSVGAPQPELEQMLRSIPPRGRCGETMAAFSATESPLFGSWQQTAGDAQRFWLPLRRRSARGESVTPTGCSRRSWDAAARAEHAPR